MSSPHTPSYYLTEEYSGPVKVVVSIPPRTKSGQPPALTGCEWEIISNAFLALEGKLLTFSEAKAQLVARTGGLSTEALLPFLQEAFPDMVCPLGFFSLSFTTSHNNTSRWLAE